MSHYEPTIRASMSRRNSPDAPAPQLPSLSSLFGPPGHPLPCPLSEVPPSYSPLDRPRGSTTTTTTTTTTSTCFQSSSTVRNTFEPRLVHGRPPYPSLSRPVADPLSPRSKHHEQRRHGCGVSGPDLRRHHTKDEASHQTRQSMGVTGTQAIPTKDGLGPKIWTGTHFLPRFVRQADVPGEGICYFYDDGSYCKNVIDGEQVKAHWGVTKAGKPRKRLAIACMTCREKKIKCDPDFPRCVQCQKLGRDCRFKNAPRGGQDTSPTSTEPEDVRRPIPAEYMWPTSQESEAVSPHTTYWPDTTTITGPSPAKRMRPSVGHHYFSPTARTPESAASFSWHRAEPLPRIHEDALGHAW